MADTQKLTKKQRKSLAFREKKGKKKSKPDPLDVPETDDVHEENIEAVEDLRQKEKVLGKRKRSEAEGESGLEQSIKPKKAKSKRSVEEVKTEEKAGDGDANIPPAASASKSSHKSRYILFIGAPAVNSFST